jgi:hypothetical protein
VGLLVHLAQIGGAKLVVPALHVRAGKNELQEAFMDNGHGISRRFALPPGAGKIPFASPGGNAMSPAVIPRPVFLGKPQIFRDFSFDIVAVSS